MLGQCPLRIPMDGLARQCREDLARCARQAAGVGRSCPVVVGRLEWCPALVIGTKGRMGWVDVPAWDGAGKNSTATACVRRYLPSTRRVIVGATFLSLRRFTCLSYDTPLPILLDAWEEERWITETQRRFVEQLAQYMPEDLPTQREALGHLGLYWPQSPFVVRGLLVAQRVNGERGAM